MGRPPIDLTGQRFGNLVALELVEHGGAHKAVKWKCLCDCGNIKITDSQLLRSGKVTHCGCKVSNRLAGQKFGKLIVIKRAHEGKRSSGIIWECQCDCGNITYVSTSNLTSTTHPTVSCGCHRIAQNTKHNLSKTNLYKTLVAIKDRCKNPNSQVYYLYGARGISLCEELDGVNGYQNFYDWSMANGWEPGLSIDRIDVNGNYCPENCRWVTQKQQANNTRRNVYITIDGKMHTLTEWSELFQISPTTVHNRLKSGWAERDAIMTPVNAKYRRKPR